MPPGVVGVVGVVEEVAEEVAGGWFAPIVNFKPLLFSTNSIKKNVSVTNMLRENVWANCEA